VDYYDSDYPGVGTSALRENLDGKLEIQGLAHDIERYLELAQAHPGPVLEICCGTGRVAIPLARAGHAVTGVDISEAMLDRFRAKLEREPDETRARVRLEKQDARQLEFHGRKFSLILLPFNSLMLFETRRDQQQVLARAAAVLHAGGRLVVDVVNPLVLPLRGDPVPAPFLSRRHGERNRAYTRFAALSPADADQRQQLYGWYDEIDEAGVVRRTPYSMWWRLVFRGELELMLEACGLVVESVEGGHRHETFQSQSSKLFVVARRP
jgi:ubiquinone/menaquinone biosynthesis C-methylase UbiE